MNISWKNCFRIGLSALILFICIYNWGHLEDTLSMLLVALVPLMTGLVIAYVLNILMSVYEKHYFLKKGRRAVCLVASIVTFCTIVALVIWLVIPELVSCIKFLLAEIPKAIVLLLKEDWVKELLPTDIVSSLSTIDWMKNTSEIIEKVGSGFGNVVNTVIGAVSSILSATMNFFIGIIFAIYLLIDKERLQSQFGRVMHQYLPRKWEKRMLHILDILNDSFHKYIVGQCSEAVILGCLCTVGMLVLRLPYAGMVGTVIGISAFIPVVGAYAGACIGAIMILTVSPVKALVFLIFIVVLQQVEGNLIYPKVVGKSIGLPAIWVLAAVTIGGSLLGIFGIIVGVPITSALYRLLREDLSRREWKES